MAKLIALRMRGIRSISDDEHVIDFLDPLTIIQGPNGTGKTTTIEALNYVTTGSLPPGRYNAFIHNNKLANKARVDALVQLKFRSCDEREITATKRMNSSLKGTKLTNKSDEYTILIKDKFGNEKSLSSKVMDCNKEMANLLGVSKAILDHVIFCHQEESCWPLSEPKVLKERFDAIFDVTRYVKAIDYVKKIIKDLDNEIHSIDTELPYLKAYINDKINENQKLEYQLNKIEENRKKIEENNALSEDLQVQLVLIRDKLRDAEEVQVKHARLTTKAEMFRVQMNSLKTVPDYAGSEDDLQSEISKILLTQDFQNAESERLTLDDEVNSVNKELVELNKTHRELNNEIIRATTENNLREGLVKEKLEKSEQVYLNYGIIAENDLNAELLKRKDDMNKELKEFHKSNDKERDELMEIINRSRDAVATQKSLENIKKAELTKIGPAINKLEYELSKSSTVDTGPILSENQVPLEEPPNIHEKRRTEAYKSAFIDGFKSGYISGYQRGYAEGRELQTETLRKNLDETKTKKADLQKEINEIRAILPKHVADLKETEEKMKNLDRQSQAEANKRTKEISDLEYLRSQINEIDKKMNNFKINSDQIEAFKRQLDQISENIQAKQNKKALLERRMSSLSSKQNEKRVLEDQLKKMEITRNLAEIEPELAEINSKFQSFQQLKKKEDSLNNQCFELERQVQRTSGEQGEISKRVDEIRRKLGEAKYRDAQKNHRDKFIEKVCRMRAIDDLNKYWKVVDNTIIEFHQTKMEQINYILQDLWAKVYQGNDIETIKIKSEAVGKDEKKKSYDYSVVMTIDQVDIDMRDRCSAGQKMLASILIRIALAEVFGGHCPILALDEPTTNLDIDKIDNISDTLRRLIDYNTSALSSFMSSANSRISSSKLKNLQLIVITHDQRLVDQLYLSCRPEHTYVLSKDETGISHIKVQKKSMDSQMYNA